MDVSEEQMVKSRDGDELRLHVLSAQDSNDALKFKLSSTGGLPLFAHGVDIDGEFDASPTRCA